MQLIDDPVSMDPKKTHVEMNAAAPGRSVGCFASALRPPNLQLQSRMQATTKNDARLQK
jgi:hypothetical protein